jgi:hypothetical protein
MGCTRCTRCRRGELSERPPRVLTVRDEAGQPVLPLRSGHGTAEACAKARVLLVVPVAGRFEVALGTGVEANPHELPATPTACEPRPHGSPVLRLHRPGADLAGALLDLRDPRLRSIGIGAIVETEDELVGDAGALPDGERERGRQDVSGLGRHREEYSPRV